MRLETVTASRGDACVLSGVSIDVARGGALGIVGPNGSGKTTVLDVISGLLSPDAGAVRFDDDDVTHLPPRRRSLAGLARTFQESHLYDELTVSEAFRVASGGARPSPEVLASIGLAGREASSVGELSTGERRRLELAAATSRGASLLLLDEPTAGVAAAERASLIADVRAWRERTGGTLIVVEHDRSALAQMVDRSVDMGDGTLAPPRDGTATNGSRPHESALVTAVRELRPARPAARPAGRPSTWALARFGLREFAAGMLSVLTLGVLNRVMKVELGIPLALVAVVLAAYNLAAPVAVITGARSDRRPAGVRRRSPYILAGASVMAAAAVLAPFAAFWLSPPTIVAAAGALALFAVMGAGMYGSGAAYFALLADVVTDGRERAVAVVYSMLMAGIGAGVALSALVMPRYDPAALVSLHGIVALLIVALTWWAVRGVEDTAVGAPRSLSPRVRDLIGVRVVRRFFVFLLGLTFFAFLQQAVLEPFGGDVFGLDVRATTAFNGVQIVALIVGMAVAAGAISPRIGKRWTTAAGAGIAALGTALLAASAAGPSPTLLYGGIVVMGFGLGLLNVGSLALMLDMTTAGAAGTSMGLWTVAHALADGAATAGGGLVHGVGSLLFADGASAYAAVFVVQSIGLLTVLGLLPRIDPGALARHAQEEEQR